jgi:hypothetical protein
MLERFLLQLNVTKNGIPTEIIHIFLHKWKTVYETLVFFLPPLLASAHTYICIYNLSVPCYGNLASLSHLNFIYSQMYARHIYS